MSNEEVEIKAMKAVLFFQDGWSLGMSMSKAGFTASWAEKIEIISHPLIKTIRAMSRNSRKHGNHNHNRINFNL